MTLVLKAGDLNRRIAILRVHTTDDGFAGDDDAFVEIGRRWASKADVSDVERIAAAAQSRSLTTRFVIRWDAFASGITGKDRVSCEGVIYQIVGVKEIGGRRIGVEITANALRE